MRALLRDLNLAVAAAFAQRIGHQPHERDVLAARLAHAVVGGVQAFQRGLLFAVRELREEPGQGAALLEGEVVIVHGVKRYTNPPAASHLGGVGEGMILSLGEMGTGFMSQRAKVLWVIALAIFPLVALSGFTIWQQYLRDQFIISNERTNFT